MSPVLLLLAIAVAPPEFRTWTDSTGKHKVVAKLVEVTKGKVQLESKTGKTTAVPLSKLSKADRDYLNDQATSAAKPPEPSPRASAKADGDPRLYELNGDRLGMSLESYIKKYARQAKDSGEQLPYRSRPGERDGDHLLSEAWFGEANIVACTPFLPAERKVGENIPTIFGVQAEVLTHHFIDGKLYRITFMFAREHFPKVAAELVAEYGETPANTIDGYNSGRVMTWENGVASIYLVEGAGDVKPPTFIEPEFRVLNTSTLVVFHNGWAKVENSRNPIFKKKRG